MKGKWVHLRIAVSFTAFVVVSILYCMSNDQLGQVQVVQVLTIIDIMSSIHYNTFLGMVPVKLEWLVDGAHCRIRNMNPFDASIQQYLAEKPPVICSKLPPLTYIAKQYSPVLTINQSLIASYKINTYHSIECCWSVITRVTQEITNYNHQADTKINVSSCAEFRQSVPLPHSAEFILVRCQSIPEKSNKGQNVYKNMHAIVPEKKPKQPPDLNPKLNVVIIGIDSVSRLSLRRTMPASLAYFNKNSWIEMNGYNKIGDNRFPNLMAILSGRTVPQIHDVCLKERIPIMDNCPSLFTDFSQHGYLTSYAEDVPILSTFNYKMTGFVKQPTDYYMRPFMLAAHAQLPVKYNYGMPVCIGSQSAAGAIFDYALDIISTSSQKNTPHFGLFWLNSLSHNDVNAPAALDQPLLNFLDQLERIGTYNNTLLLILSDHGVRFGEIRNTFLGFLEERLPFLFFHLPQWFLDKYPEANQNLLNNQHRLTSPYDLHATLNSLLSGGTSQPPFACPTCRSLFEPIPLNRTCADAGIDTDWCTCPNFSSVSVEDPLVVQAGYFLNQHVVNRTLELIVNEKRPPTMCKLRKLEKILRVHQSTPIGQEHTDNLLKLFVVVIVTKPLGLFEATVRIDFSNSEPEFYVEGFISRLDSYFTTSKCARSKMLQFYCHCSL